VVAVGLSRLCTLLIVLLAATGCSTDRTAPAAAASASASAAATFPASLHDPARCEQLEARYRELWQTVDRCSEDSDCLADARGRFWVGLDGCWRFRNRATPRSDADAVADEWLSIGCARDVDVCKPPPAAICIDDHCAEKPPGEVPLDWRRIDVARTFSFFLPPDMKRQQIRGVDSIVRRFAGKKATLMFDYGQYADTLGTDEGSTAGVDDPFRVQEAEKNTKLGGKPARVIHYRLRKLREDSTWQVTGYGRAVHFRDVPSKARLPFGLVGVPALTIYVEGASDEDCAIADRIFESIEFR
jgi:hypothetical protein